MLRLGRPWAHSDFDAALEREVTACEGADVESERARRHRAHQSRKVRVRVHDDGTATLVVRGPAVAIVGIHDRYDHIARTMRGQGHENPLAHLVVDSMLAVLGFGHLDLPDPGSLAELSSTDLDDLIAVVNGAPRIALQVIVPLDALAYSHPNFPEFDDPRTYQSRDDRPAEQDCVPGSAAATQEERPADDGRPFDHATAPPPDWAGPQPPGPPSTTQPGTHDARGTRDSAGRSNSTDGDDPRGGGDPTDVGKPPDLDDPSDTSHRPGPRTPLHTGRRLRPGHPSRWGGARSGTTPGCGMVAAWSPRSLAPTRSSSRRDTCESSSSPRAPPCTGS